MKIDDLPDYYKFKDDVIAWEQHFFEIKEDTLFRADIDTTFALHRPTAPGGYVDDILTYRTAYPYEIRHLPWYENSDMISEEERYYLANKRKEIGWWSSKTELK